MKDKNKASGLIKNSLEEIMKNYTRPTRKSDPIYHAIKQALEKTIKQLPPGTRLPAVRKIAVAFDVSLVTAHKAIRELIDEKAIYSKDKSGLYTCDKNAQNRGDSPDDSTFRSEGFKGFVSFATDSCSSWQKPLWDSITNSFNSCSLVSAKINYDFAYTYNEPDSLFPDCMEFSDWSLSSRTPDHDFLELDDFLEALDCGRKLTIKNKFLPLYNSGISLFINRQKMTEMKLPLPGYSTYESQVEYLNKLSHSMGARKLTKNVVVKIIPSDFSDHFFPLFMMYLENGKQAVLEQLMDYTEQLQAFYGNIYNDFWGCDHAANQRLLQSFGTGNTPFFIGGSVDAWQLNATYSDNNLEAIPLLSPDNTLISRLICGAVSASSSRPVESIRFLLYLRQQEQQEKFASFGFAPCGTINEQSEIKPDNNCLSADKDCFVSNSSIHYIKYCIFNSELLEQCQKKIAAADIIRRAALLSKAYLKTQS